MAKRIRSKSKNTLLKPKLRDRRKVPLIGKMKNRQVILCPFCDPSHPLSTNKVSHCGTILEVSARQMLYKNVTCALCGKMDGELTQVGPELYQHAHECSPGKKIYITPPKTSMTAKLIFPLPESIHLLIARVFGKVSVELLDSQGKPNGKYTWEDKSRL